MTNPKAFDLSRALESFVNDVRNIGFEADVDASQNGTGALAFGAPTERVRADVDVRGRHDCGISTTGFAKANSSDPEFDAGGYGLFIADNGVGDGTFTNASDSAVGTARIFGTTKAEARGVSVGLREFLDPDEIDDPSLGGEDGGGEDEDEEDFGPGPDDFLPLFSSRVATGRGDDSIEGASFVNVDFTGEELQFAAANGVHIDRDGVLATGAGDDFISGFARLKVKGGDAEDQGEDGLSLPDPDREAIADGMENGGLIDTGRGDDTIEVRAISISRSGATAIADGLDNSSVGNPNPVSGDLPPSEGVRLLMGSGDDVVRSFSRARSEGDASIANGFDTRSFADFGSGNDRVELKVRSTFVDSPDFLGIQEEAIADGLDNRGAVRFGRGDDALSVDVRSEGNGVLTIAGGIETRGNPGIDGDGEGRGIAIDMGSGADRIEALARAVATAPIAGDENAGQEPAKTVAHGMVTQNNASGVVRMGTGADTVDLTGIASGRATDTVAFGLTNWSFDLPNVNVRSQLDLGKGRDTLDASARADGTGKVAATGIWAGEILAGFGRDAIEGRAVVTSAAEAEAIGVKIDDDFTLFPETGPGAGTIVSEAGSLVDLGAAKDALVGFAAAKEDVESGFAAGIYVGEDGLLDAGRGWDVVVGIGRFRGEEGEAFGIYVGEGGLLEAGRGRDVVVGIGRFRGEEGEAFGIGGEAGGRIDTGGGADLVDASAGGFGGGILVDLGAGRDTIVGFGEVTVDGGSGFDTAVLDFSLRRLARDGGHVEVGTDSDFEIARAGEVMKVSDVEVFEFRDGAVHESDLVRAFEDLIA